jgi:hypothetical protein
MSSRPSFETRAAAKFTQAAYTCLRARAPQDEVRGYRNLPRASTRSVPMISSPRTITTSSIMLTTTQT